MFDLNAKKGALNESAPFQSPILRLIYRLHRHRILLLRATPCAMDFTYLLTPLGLGNHPCHDAEGRGTPIRSLPKLLHHTNEVLIILWNEFSVLLQTWFSWPCGRRSIGSGVLFFQRLPLPQLSHSDQRLMAHTDFAASLIDHELFHSCSLCRYGRSINTDMSTDLQRWGLFLVPHVVPRPMTVAPVGPRHHLIFAKLTVPF